MINNIIKVSMTKVSNTHVHIYINKFKFERWYILGLVSEGRRFGWLLEYTIEIELWYALRVLQAKSYV